MVSSFRVCWGFGRRSWFEIIIMLSVGVGVLVSLFVGLWVVVVWVRLGLFSFCCWCVIWNRWVGCGGG